jgi:predicted ester cyclase
MASNKETYRHLIEDGYVNNDVGVLDEVCAEGYVNHEALGGDLDASEEKELIADVHEGFSDLRIELLDLFGEGDLVCCRWRATGTHTGMLYGFQPTGNSLQIDGVDVAHFSGGKIQELWSTYDTLGFLRQVGASAAPSVGEQPRPSA